MIAAYPHLAFGLALLCGAALGFIAGGVVRTGHEADEEDAPLPGHEKPVRTRIWGGDVHNGGKS